MSGLAAPLRTTTPTPARATCALLSASTLPCLIRSSTPALVETMKSVCSPLSMRWAIRPDVSESSTSLCPLACSNSGLMSAIADLNAPDCRTRISAASAAVAAAKVSAAASASGLPNIHSPVDCRVVMNYTLILGHLQSLGRGLQIVGRALGAWAWCSQWLQCVSLYHADFGEVDGHGGAPLGRASSCSAEKCR